MNWMMTRTSIEVRTVCFERMKRESVVSCTTAIFGGENAGGSFIDGEVVCGV